MSVGSIIQDIPYCMFDDIKLQCYSQSCFVLCLVKALQSSRCQSSSSAFSSLCPHSCKFACFKSFLKEVWPGMYWPVEPDRTFKGTQATVGQHLPCSSMAEQAGTSRMARLLGICCANLWKQFQIILYKIKQFKEFLKTIMYSIYRQVYIYIYIYPIKSHFLQQIS